MEEITIGTESVPNGLHVTKAENILEENDLLIERETSHAKVFRIPNRSYFPKIIFCICVIGFLILVTTCLITIWSTQSKDIDVRNIAVNKCKSGYDSLECSSTSNQIVQKTTKKEKFLKYLHGISGSKTISGIYAYESRNSSKACENFYNITGVFPGIVSTIMPSHTASDSSWMSFTDEVISNWNNQYLVRIDWYWGDAHPMMGKSEFRNSYGHSVQKMKDFIQDGSRLNKIWKKELDKIAPYFRKLQTAGVITILDMFPEINHPSHFYGGVGGENGTAKVYKLTHDYLTKHHNLTSFVWTLGLHEHYFSQLDEFWPGSEYVDVASVDMYDKRELEQEKYEKLLAVVGDKPISMDWLKCVPSIQLLAIQTRWTWFTAFDADLNSGYLNGIAKMKATFKSTINKGDIDFFNDTNTN